MQAIKAIYDGAGFKPKQPIPVQGHYEVVITFLEQIAHDDASPNKAKKEDIEFWREFDELVANSQDEELSLDDFPKLKFSRELIIFEDEEQAI